MKKLAERHCNGRLVLSHEGGYSAAYVPCCALAIVEAMSGIQTKVEDPFMESFSGVPVDTLFPHEEEAVQKVIEQQSKFWDLSAQKAVR